MFERPPLLLFSFFMSCWYIPYSITWQDSTPTIDSPLTGVRYSSHHCMEQYRWKSAPSKNGTHYYTTWSSNAVVNADRKASYPLPYTQTNSSPTSTAASTLLLLVYQRKSSIVQMRRLISSPYFNNPRHVETGLYCGTRQGGRKPSIVRGP